VTILYETMINKTLKTLKFKTVSLCTYLKQKVLFYFFSTDTIKYLNLKYTEKIFQKMKKIILLCVSALLLVVYVDKTESKSVIFKRQKRQLDDAFDNINQHLVNPSEQSAQDQQEEQQQVDENVSQENFDQQQQQGEEDQEELSNDKETDDELENQEEGGDDENNNAQQQTQVYNQENNNQANYLEDDQTLNNPRDNEDNDENINNNNNQQQQQNENSNANEIEAENFDKK
jgi:hypothetical protein